MKKNNGFTLVELAIVLMIIGLLIGGVLKGQEMMKNARVTAFISQTKGYHASLVSFQDAYSAVPGDMANATLRLPNCTAANYCLNGNGNTIIGLNLDQNNPNARFQTDQSGVNAPQVETTEFWKHLALADFITGVNPGANPAAPAWGETHPSSKVNGGFSIITFNHAGHSGFWLVNRTSPIGSALVPSGQNTMSPRMASMIDRKMDDGLPDEGYVQVPDNGDCDGVPAGGGMRAYHDLDQNNCALSVFIM